MDEQTVRDHARAMCEAIVAGDVDRAIEDVSPELRRNLGEVISLFPLPSKEATIESVAQGGSSYVVVLRLVGETDEVQVQTRWKDRTGAHRRGRRDRGRYRRDAGLTARPPATARSPLPLHPDLFEVELALDHP